MKCLTWLIENQGVRKKERSMIQIHPKRPFIYIEKQSYVTIKPKCKLCHIQLSLEKAAEVSFMLSGIPSTKRQWENIQRFAKMQYYSI